MWMVVADDEALKLQVAKITMSHDSCEDFLEYILTAITMLGDHSRYHLSCVISDLHYCTTPIFHPILL